MVWAAHFIIATLIIAIPLIAGVMVAMAGVVKDLRED